MFTLCFAFSGVIPLFTLAWLGNRLTQSLAWAGLVKVSSKWFDFSSHGAVIGVLSVSYLIGDAGARQSMGMLIQHGFGWRTLFYYAAAVAGFFLIANLLLLRESRKQMGIPEAHANPLNLFAESEERPRSLRTLLGPLVRSRAFLLVCFLSLGCTIIRETFNDWTPIYLREYLGYSTGHAAKLSAIFPGLGAVSVVFTGWLSDKLGINGRSIIMMVGLALTAAALLLMRLIPASTSGSILPLIAIGTIAFCLLGPYSYLAGAFALDFGGKQAGAMSSGMIDGVGYLGAVMGGVTVAQFSVAFGWQGVFVGLAHSQRACRSGRRRIVCAWPQGRGDRRTCRMSVFDEILAIYESLGASAYYGEPVSMTEHGLQAAHFAQAERRAAGTRRRRAAARHRASARARAGRHRRLEGRCAPRGSRQPLARCATACSR